MNCSADITKYLQLTSIEFVRRVRRHAKSLSVPKIYFLARDATYFNALNERLNSVESFTVPGMVLHVNRKLTWLSQVKPDESGIKCSIKRFMASRNRASIKDYYDYWGFELVADQDSRLTVATDVEGLLKLILDSPHLTQEIVNSIVLNQTNLTAYLENSGVDLSRECVFVDIGYKSSIATSLTHMLAHYRTSHPLPTIYNFQYLRDSGVKVPMNVRVRGLSYLDSDRLPQLLNANYGWLEFFFKDQSLGELRAYQANASTGEIEAIRDSPKGQGGYRLNIPNETSEFAGDNVSNEDTEKFLQAMLRPSKELVQNIIRKHGEQSTHDHHCEVLVRTVRGWEMLNPLEIKRLILGDYWVSGSLVYSNLNWMIAYVQIVYGLSRFLK